MRHVVAARMLSRPCVSMQWRKRRLDITIISTGLIFDDASYSDSREWLPAEARYTVDSIS